MTALIIILCILFVLAVLLILPVHFKAEYKGGVLKAAVRYTFYTKKLSPAEKKPKKEKTKKPEPKPEADEKPEDKKPAKKQKISQKIRSVCDLLQEALKAFPVLFRHIRIKKLDLRISVCGEDAADAALQYGEVCAAVYPVSGVLLSNADADSTRLDIRCDYTGADSDIYLNIALSLSLIFAVLAAVKFFFGLVRKNIKRNKTKQRR